MSSCCDPRGCDAVFGPRFARHAASRYRKRGLDRTAQRIADWLEAQDIRGASVLDIGGGVGEIGLALLQNGAARATTVELSSAYDEPAADLAREAGVADRVERRLGDLAADGSVAEPADFVVLHRVVCCYPDYERLLCAAAEHARRAVVLSHPPRNALSLSMLAVENLGLRLGGREYRTFAHPPAEMVQVLRGQGFATEYIHRGLIWQVLAATRETAPNGRGSAATGAVSSQAGSVTRS